MELVKITTGIEGLDQMLKGGLIQNRSYIIVGGPGTGKTIMSMQFLVEGTRHGEEGLFLALEENAGELKENMSLFGWDLKRIKIVDTSQEMSGKWTIRVESVVAGPELTLSNILNILKEYILKYNIKRVVIDSLTSFKVMQKSSMDYRRNILTLMKFLSTSGCTSIMTIETDESKDIMEEFLASGAIELGFSEHNGEWLNYIRIKKMRGMPIDQHVRPLKITEKGVTVFANETLLR